MGRDRIDWVSLKPREAIAPYLRWREAVVRADQGDLEPLIVELSDQMTGTEVQLAQAKVRPLLRLRRGD